MKKLLLLASLAFAFTGKSQSSFQVTELSTGSPAQWSYTFNTDTNNMNAPAELIEFKITNTSATSKITKIRKYVMSLANTSGVTHDIYFCYNQTCFGPPTNYWYATIASGASLPNGSGTSYGLRTEFDHNKVVGTSVVRYTIYDSTNISDSVNITITYNVAAVSGVKANQASARSLTVSPNPASNVVNLNYDLSDSENAVVKIFNSLGNLVKTVSLMSGTKNTQVDISTLEEGFYFYSLISDGKAVTTRRLVVTR